MAERDRKERYRRKRIEKDGESETPEREKGE